MASSFSFIIHDASDYTKTQRPAPRASSNRIAYSNYLDAYADFVEFGGGPTCLWEPERQARSLLRQMRKKASAKAHRVKSGRVGKAQAKAKSKPRKIKIENIKIEGT